MRILFLSVSHPWNAEIDQAMRVASGMSARGHRCLWMAREDSASLGRARDGGLEWAALPGRDFKRSLVDWLRARNALDEAAGRFRPDILFTLESPAHLLGALARGAGRPGSPALVRWRWTALPLRANPFSRRLYDRHTRLVLAAADLLRRQAAAAGFDVRHWRVLPGCVDLERFAPGAPVPGDFGECGFPAGAEVLTLVARLAPVKGVDHFLGALARLRRDGRDLKGLLVGEAWEGQAARLEATVRRLGLDGQVCWLGPRADVPRWFRMARVGVVSSVGSEVHSRAALECLACGVPLAATRVGVLPEWLEGLAFARLAVPGDDAALAEAIASLLDAPHRDRLAWQARRFVEQGFSSQSMLDHAEASLQEALAGR